MKLDPCPGGFCCYFKLDSSYQISKIAEIFWVNEQGALEKQLDPGRQTGIPETELLLQEQRQQAVAIYPGTHIIVYVISRDKTQVVLTSHCTKSLMQCLFFDISCSPLQFRLVKYRF